MVTSVLELLTVDFRKRNVAVRANLASQLPPVVADRVQLCQVLMSLLVNAMDAMTNTPPAMRLLEVSTSWFDNNRAEVVVADNGSGMTRGQAKHAFESFFTTKKTGMGLGLSIARSIVLNYHGAIWCEPRSAGGTSFHFTLPKLRSHSGGLVEDNR